MKQQLLDRPEPSPVLVEARQLAGQHLERQFKYRYNKNIDEHKNYRWIKSEWTYPSFEHFTFAYKNKLFPVFIELIEDGKSSMTENNIVNLVNSSKKYNLTPCVFKMKIVSYQNNRYENRSSYNMNNNYIFPLSNGWNLYDPLTGDNIIPEDLGNELPIQLSDWEMLNFAIQIVIDDIKKKSWKIFSFCDLLEINPQIWIEDNFGRRSWVIVRNIEKEEDNEPHRWINIIKDTSILEDFDGYFAGVRFLSTNGSNTILRGEASFIDYKGIKSAYLGK
jgi:hypothetical protein